MRARLQLAAACRILKMATLAPETPCSSSESSSSKSSTADGYPQHSLSYPIHHGGAMGVDDDGFLLISTYS